MSPTDPARSTARPERLENAELAVECVPGAGFTITAIEDRLSGANALWTRQPFEPADTIRAVGPSGEASIESFSDLFIGGWFEMFPTTGYPGPIQGPLGTTQSLLHGEVMRLPWQVTYRDRTTIEATVTTVRTPFRLTRRLQLDGGALLIEERAEHLGREPAPYVWGQHPCFARSTFAGGRFWLDVDSASVPAPAYDQANNTLVEGAEFRFPHATAIGPGGSRDVAAIPSDPDGRHEHVSIAIRSGQLRITAPMFNRVFSLEWDPSDFPYVLIWQNYLAPNASFWGTCDTFAIEPSSAPGRSVEDAVAHGAIRWLTAGESASTRIRVAWSSP
jgi:galactose mutarotase-like enzyme